MMKLWGYIEQKGAWISFDQEIIDLAKSKNIECPEKIQGENKLTDFINQNKEFTNFMLEQIQSNF